MNKTLSQRPAKSGLLSLSRLLVSLFAIAISRQLAEKAPNGLVAAAAGAVICQGAQVVNVGLGCRNFEEHTWRRAGGRASKSVSQSVSRMVKLSPLRAAIASDCVP